MKNSLPQKIFLLILSLGLLYILLHILNIHPKSWLRNFKPTPTPAPPPKISQVNGKAVVKYPQDYTLVLLGDSMTERLGNSDELREDLTKYYPQKSFEVLNYGFGSTNILSALDRLTQETDHGGRKFRPILDIDFDLILIESFGNNPLSQYSLEQGLQIQNQTLDKIVETLTAEGKKDKVAFVSTISPNIKNYAKTTVDLTDEKRIAWGEERKKYMENHIQYALSHHIPIIDIYHPSQDSTGDGNLDYIDKEDYIHPSPKGIIFISKVLADGIFNQNLLR